MKELSLTQPIQRYILRSLNQHISFCHISTWSHDTRMQSACIASERDKLIPWYPVPLFVATTLRCRLSLFFQVDEKWNALVRYRKAVNAHTLEVTRLQNLLKVAQGGEDRSRLTSELEQVSSKFNLESMEDAMHMEV